jgi:hypothetical protein
MPSFLQTFFQRPFSGQGCWPNNKEGAPKKENDAYYTRYYGFEYDRLKNNVWFGDYWLDDGTNSKKDNRNNKISPPITAEIRERIFYACIIVST